MGAQEWARIIRIDLDGSRVSEEQLSEVEYRRYMGGSALIGRILLSETGSGVDPWSGDNPLIFAPGVMTGTPVAGSGRNAVGAVSPLTGGYGCSEAGGFFPAELRRAGIAAIIVTGVAAEPVYLMIDGDDIELRPADALWGRPVHEVDRELRDRLGRGFRVAAIGPAGERLVRFASVHNDISHVNGRTGMGAVMGSKKLKAVAVRGRGAVPIADPDALKAITSEFLGRWRDQAGGLHDTGTAGLLTGLDRAGGLPTRAFQKGSFAGASSINGQKLRDTLLTGRDTCWACPIQCKRVVTVTGTYKADPELGGPEYETLAALGSMCEVSDLEAICCANALCNSYGMDTISTGVVVAFVMECNERGLLEQKHAAPDVRFGDAAGMVELVRMIGERSGFGDLLAEGVSRASQVIGRGSEDIALHVRGQELPMHEPRYKRGLGLGYAVSATGADHCHNLHDPAYMRTGTALDALAPLGVLEPVSLESMGPDKVRLFRRVAGWRHFCNCAVICYFVPWTPSEVSSLLAAITGWDTSLHELMTVSERTVNLARCFNVRRGSAANDDRLPARLFEPIQECSIAGTAVDRDQFDSALKCLYAASGWDENGVPTAARLHDLDIGWAVEAMNR